MAVSQLDRVFRLLEMALDLFIRRAARAGTPTTIKDDDTDNEK